jgi:hypothetical protein
MHTRPKTSPAPVLAFVVALLTLVGCGSGGLGDIIGPSTDSTVYSSEIRGTVDQVDTRNRQIILVDASQRQLGSSSLQNDSPLDTRDGSLRDRVAIDYDGETYVEFQGDRYEPTALERGDRIVAVVDESRNRYLARSIEVTHDATPDGNDRWGADDRWEDDRGNDTWGDDDRWASQVEGVVRDVDTRDRIVTLEKKGNSSWGSPNLVQVRYDNWTRVEYQGQVGKVDRLEKGDRVIVRSREDGRDPVAEEIEVLTSVSHDDVGDRGGDAWSGDALRGRVISVDTRARVLEVEEETSGWGSQSRGRTVRLYYDNRTTVEYRGRTDYTPDNLERGDLVEIDTRRVGDGYLAEEILVVESVSG